MSDATWASLAVLIVMAAFALAIPVAHVLTTAAADLYWWLVSDPTPDAGWLDEQAGVEMWVSR